MTLDKNSFNQRKWLLRLTALISIAFLVSFFYIFIRGLIWSPNSIDNRLDLSAVQLSLGTSDIFQFSGKRVWLTRFSEKQHEQLRNMNEFVYQEGGCDLGEINTEKESYCMLQVETQIQGVIIRYISERPHSLSKDTPWVGGFINPADGAIYDLSGRLYKQILIDSENTRRHINIDY